VDSTAPNTIARTGKFDAAHRVLDERFQCFHLHGHEYRYELSFEWEKSLELGYPIDFKEIKRVLCTWIDEHMDHSFIANPTDTDFICLCKKHGLKVYEMHGAETQGGYCNPTAENIAKELFFASHVLLESSFIRTGSIKLWETQNCYVLCTRLAPQEFERFTQSSLYSNLLEWRKKKGTVEYDSRKISRGDQ
jgi:6-pyruvoyltetrahydropterin/6-carboxytetrahydropterin synthase